MPYNKRTPIFFTIVFLLCLNVAAIDSLDFVAPVQHEIKLSGNFMELRTNHFHTGIDIKSSNGKTGDPILSIGEGYISRVKIQSGSYGQVLYIDHPNGYTSVYAHLEAFQDTLEQWIKDLQYDLQSYELDIYLPDSLFQVGKGEMIGRMGNTGRSFGPHLHFELRETSSEKPINPEILHFVPDDTIDPIIQSLRIYEFDQLGHNADSYARYFKRTQPEYSLHNDLIKSDAPMVAFGLQCFDQINGSYNKNGINAYQVYVNDSLFFYWKAENYSFHESKRINGFIDYERKYKSNQTVYKLFKPDCASLEYFSNQEGNGILKLVTDSIYNIRIEISDFKNNESILKFKVSSAVSSNTEINPAQINCDSVMNLSAGMFKARVPGDILFKHNGGLNFEAGKAEVMGSQCHMFKLGKAHEAVSSYYTVSCPLPPKDLEKYTFVGLDNKGRYIHFGADTISGQLYTQLDQLGSFFVYKDIVPPTIELLQYGDRINKPFLFRISDNLIPDGKVEDLSYEAFVNGRWVRMIYDLKTRTLLFKDFDKIPDQENIEFVLKVADAQDNESIWMGRL